MKLNYIPLLIILLIELIFISGCASEQTIPAESSDCPYAGTYSGLVSGSGERTKYTEDGPVITPYIVTYNLEVTFECDKSINPVEPCYDSEKPDQMCLYHRIAHAKVSDPYFDCTNGCIPASGSLTVPIGGERGGHLLIDFPNGAGLNIVDSWFK